MKWVIGMEAGSQSGVFPCARLVEGRSRLNTPFSEIEFDFTLTGITTKDAEDVVHRRRVEAA